MAAFPQRLEAAVD